ncbi:recombination-associated protein RdgC [Buttiauxella agrestis]|uniref:recombination-associated protein RdgC n=1 Tax=Buttiauxella agrestis TaxID=82977 RepID=UPI003976F6A9
MIRPTLKNLFIYRLSRDVAIMSDEATFANQLQAFIFSPCGSQDMAKTGWVSPLGKMSDQLFHLAGAQIFLVIRREEKVIPSAVIKDELAEKISKLESDQGRRLKKTEKDSLRDEVLHSLLPRAFSRNSSTKIWIDSSKGLVIVDTGSSKRAEDALALLRKTLGSLPVVPLTMESPIELSMTEWVRSGEMPTGFAMRDEAELKAILEGGGVARVTNQDLVSDEVATHIGAGKVVTRLALDWQERVTFTLDDCMVIKKVKFSDSLLDQNDDIDREDIAQRFDADFILFTGELSHLITSLTAALGGEAQR